MLDFKKNRLDYGELLMPPDGYTLTHAVATTYSLDLYTLLAVPVALVYSKMMEGDFEKDRFDVIESIQEIAGKLTIYCQKGKIQVPKKYNWLFAFLEDSIVQVTPSSHLSSFHPKVWILRFSKGDRRLLRLIVLSRNLTFDRSWDMAFHMDGQITERMRKENEPLVAFLEFLKREKTFRGAREIIKDLPYTQFTPPEGFDGFGFYPIGIDAFKQYTNPMANTAFERMLIISPFLDQTTLKKIHGNNPGRKVLLSREEELQEIPEEVFEGYEPYFLSRRIVDGESAENIDETTEEPKPQDLHAKLFVGERDREFTWYIGSANCTDPAFTRNTEFMVKLSGSSPRIGPKAIEEILLPKNDDMMIFEPFAPKVALAKDDAGQLKRQLRKLLHDLISAEFNGKVIKRKKTTNFDVGVSVDLKKTSWSGDIAVVISPFNFYRGGQPLVPGRMNRLEFENFSLAELSRFLTVTIACPDHPDISFLIKMAMDIPEGRERMILKSMIGSRETFFKYLGFLLSDTPYSEENTIEKYENGDGDKRRGWDYNDLPIFENLLLTASRYPHKLKAVDRLIERLKDDDAGEDGEKIVPKAFHDFWYVFKQATGIR